MKPILTPITIAIALMLSTAFLLGKQTSAWADQDIKALTTAQAQQFYRDLVRSNSQAFFQQGKVQLEREIQILTQEQLSSRKPLLNIQDVSHTPIDGFSSTLPTNQHHQVR